MVIVDLLTFSPPLKDARFLGLDTKFCHLCRRAEVSQAPCMAGKSFDMGEEWRRSHAFANHSLPARQECSTSDRTREMTTSESRIDANLIGDASRLEAKAIRTVFVAPDGLRLARKSSIAKAAEQKSSSSNHESGVQIAP
jgi:hypothetical protein